MALTHSPLIVTDNLVFCVDAANTKSYSGSGTIWKDISGEGDDGTLINGPTFSNDNGGSIVFDGSDDKVDVNGDSSSFVLGSDNFSAETWVWFDSVSVGGIISKHASSIPHWFEYRIGATGKILTQVSLNGSSWGISYQSTTSVTTNRWYNIMLVRDGSSFKTYINGIDGGGSGSSSSSISNNTSYPFRMGLRGGDDQALDGRIAVVKIYKGKALSSTEVKQNYNTLKGRFL